MFVPQNGKKDEMLEAVKVLFLCVLIITFSVPNLSIRLFLTKRAQELRPELEKVKFRYVKEADLQQRLLQFEQNQIQRCHRVALLYCKYCMHFRLRAHVLVSDAVRRPGQQSDTEMFNNGTLRATSICFCPIFACFPPSTPCSYSLPFVLFFFFSNFASIDAPLTFGQWKVLQLSKSSWNSLERKSSCRALQDSVAAWT